MIFLIPKAEYGKLAKNSILQSSMPKMGIHGQKSRYEVYLDYFHTPRWFFDVRQEVFVANP